jgi:hypothetical protein
MSRSFSHLILSRCEFKMSEIQHDNHIREYRLEEGAAGTTELFDQYNQQ